uniref:Uncharacterized protein n=1 Tax=Zea mays TaxID=4577 RepID=C4J5A3_MAIZE|nr:unknown [Zea mays]
MPPGSTKAEVWNTPAHPSKARCRLSGSITFAITVHTPSLPSSPNISISRSLSMSSCVSSARRTVYPCRRRRSTTANPTKEIPPVTHTARAAAPPASPPGLRLASAWPADRRHPPAASCPPPARSAARSSSTSA